MNCIKCGRKISDAARFCPECGTASSSDPAQQSLPRMQATATGTRDQIQRSGMVYPKNPPLSPHLAWLNLLYAGIPQIVFGQVMKGIILIVIATVSLFTVPVIGIIIIDIVAIIDSYKVGNKLASGRPVGKMEWFPS